MNFEEDARDARISFSPWHVPAMEKPAITLRSRNGVLTKLSPTQTHPRRRHWHCHILFRLLSVLRATSKRRRERREGEKMKMQERECERISWSSLRPSILPRRRCVYPDVSVWKCLTGWQSFSQGAGREKSSRSTTMCFPSSSSSPISVSSCKAGRRANEPPRLMKGERRGRR